jgi:acyl homoserine lactone synthase
MILMFYYPHIWPTGEEDMTSVIIAKADDPILDTHTKEDMFRFRHKVFRERLEWDVETNNGMEIDRFDALMPVYMVAKSDHGVVVGSWRFLSTTSPYMLKDTFPQLLRGEVAPESDEIWELSRFAVESSDSGDLAQASISSTTFEMLRSAVEYADEKGIRHYVTVTSVGLERLLKSVGIPLRRFGDGKAERVGKVLSVACWVDIDDRLRWAVSRKLTAPVQHRRAA